MLLHAAAGCRCMLLLFLVADQHGTDTFEALCRIPNLPFPGVELQRQVSETFTAISASGSEELLASDYKSPCWASLHGNYLVLVYVRKP